MMNQESLAMSYGLGSAVTFGAGDFSGGFVTRRCHVLTVILFSQMIGAVFLLAVTLASKDPFPPVAHMLRGGLAGVFGVLGLMALYRGLAAGRMGIVAPLSAVISAMLPIVYGFFIEGQPRTTQMIGFAAALLAVWLLSYSKSASKIAFNEICFPLLAGLGFGLFFIFFDSASSTSVFWPLVSARLAAIVLTGSLYLLNGKPGLPYKTSLVFVFLAGVFDIMGNAFFGLAAQLGRLDISAALSSLYPAATVILAWIVLKERLLRQQWVGVCVALASLGLIAL